jgi:hypothetical protein
MQAGTARCSEQECCPEEDGVEKAVYFSRKIGQRAH